MMPKITSDFLKKLDSIRGRVDESAEKILPKINIDKLLQDKRGYMGKLAKQFYNAHKKELKDGIKAGEKKAKKYLAESS